MESFSNSKGPQSITKKLEDPKGITKGNIDVAAWTHKFSLATRYQRLNCFFGAAIDMSKVKSWTFDTFGNPLIQKVLQKKPSSYNALHCSATSSKMGWRILVDSEFSWTLFFQKGEF